MRSRLAISSSAWSRGSASPAKSSSTKPCLGPYSLDTPASVRAKPPESCGLAVSMLTPTSYADRPPASIDRWIARAGRGSTVRNVAPRVCDHPPMSPDAIVVRPGEGHRAGNIEFLARTADTPRFNFAIIEIAAGRVLEEHVHDQEDDAFYIVEGEMTFTFGEEEASAPPGTFVLVPPGVAHGFRNDGDAPVRMLNIHAPAGFDERVGLSDKAERPLP
jgi:mannose-6-phosphate isomerase-like protein (cupin superfamily)